MTKITHNLNRSAWMLTLLMLLLMLLLTSTQLSPPVQARERMAGERGLTVECDNPYISQRDASWLLGSDNFGQTYAKRRQLYAEVARVCAAGFETVRIERKAAARPPPRVAQRR